MRVWDIPPCYLNRQSLLGEHREIHAIHAVLSQQKNGYSRHPETRRWQGRLPALRFRHDQVVAEMRLRGFGHFSPLPLDLLAPPAANEPWPGIFPELYLDPPARQFAMLAEKYRNREAGRLPLPGGPLDRPPPGIAISACLVGLPGRYDGGDKLDKPLLALLAQQKITLLPICPEAECGLGIPREPMRLEGEPGRPRLLTTPSRRDLTDPLAAWSAQRLRLLVQKEVGGFILKARSPSCGKEVAIHGPEQNNRTCGPGIFAHLIMASFSGPLADEEELRDPARFKAFIEQLIPKTIKFQEQTG